MPCMVRDVLRENGYAEAAIAMAMSAQYPGAELQLTACHDYRAWQSRAQYIANGPGVTQVDTGGRFPLLIIDDFLSPDQCEQLVAISVARAERSVVATGAQDEVRTSKTCYLQSEFGSIVDEIDQAIARRLGVQPGYSELIQAQVYEVGEQFKVHGDYFGPRVMREARETLLHPGQRTWTFMVYLEVPEQGGATRFTDLGIDITPKLGRAAAWFNLTDKGEINLATVHQGMPVEAGRKTIITKWFRDEGAGAPFYD